MNHKVLVACEESQRVCNAFRKRGFEAYSCDIQDTSGEHPEWHIIGDVREILDRKWNRRSDCRTVWKLFEKGGVEGIELASLCDASCLIFGCGVRCKWQNGKTMLT